MSKYYHYFHFVDEELEEQRLKNHRPVDMAIWYNHHTIYQGATRCMTDTELHIQINSLMCSREQSWRITVNTPILHTAAPLIHDIEKGQRDFTR